MRLKYKYHLISRAYRNLLGLSCPPERAPCGITPAEAAQRKEEWAYWPTTVSCAACKSTRYYRIFYAYEYFKFWSDCEFLSDCENELVLKMRK